VPEATLEEEELILGSMMYKEEDRPKVNLLQL